MNSDLETSDTIPATADEVLNMIEVLIVCAALEWQERIFNEKKESDPEGDIFTKEDYENDKLMEVTDRVITRSGLDQNDWTEEVPLTFPKPAWYTEGDLNCQW